MLKECNKLDEKYDFDILSAYSSPVLVAGFFV